MPSTRRSASLSSSLALSEQFEVRRNYVIGYRRTVACNSRVPSHRRGQRRRLPPLSPGCMKLQQKQSTTIVVVTGSQKNYISHEHFQPRMVYTIVDTKSGPDRTPASPFSLASLLTGFERRAGRLGRAVGGGSSTCSTSDPVRLVLLERVAMYESVSKFCLCFFLVVPCFARVPVYLPLA